MHDTPDAPDVPTSVAATPAISIPAASPPAASYRDPVGDEIAELCAHIDAAQYRLLTLLRRYDEEELWSGWRSCAHWLNWRAGISLGAARERLRAARRLADLPLTSTEMEKGRLSWSKVRALTRMATPENEARLVEFALHHTASQVERLVRAWEERGGGLPGAGRDAGAGGAGGPPPPDGSVDGRRHVRGAGAAYARSGRPARRDAGCGRRRTLPAGAGHGARGRSRHGRADPAGPGTPAARAPADPGGAPATTRSGRGSRIAPRRRSNWSSTPWPAAPRSWPRRRAHTFPRERPGDWPATRKPWK